MHFSALVIIENPDERPIDEQVSDVMDQHKHLWDWYQIGGRWSGLADRYEPDKDPQHIVECRLCGGTGTRPDMVVADGCNGCLGTGKHTTWPTEWKRHDGDVFPIAQLTEGAMRNVHTVLSGSDEFLSERYEPWRPSGETFVKQDKPSAEWLKSYYENATAVVVDFHN